MSSPAGPNSSGSLSASDHRQTKRKVSNRESARRSRMRKQNHLHGLMAQATQLSKDNACILTNLNLTKQMCINVQGENFVLRAQMSELTHRLNSLNQMIGCYNQIHHPRSNADLQMNDLDFFNSWNLNPTVCHGNIMNIMY